jgi:small-conductance mechanosensitive channel
MRLLNEAALKQDRVMRDPGPGVNLTNFGADGLEFTLNYWMTDPENGQQNLRSRVNLAILASLRAHGIDIPYPQRVVHTRVSVAEEAKDAKDANGSKAGDATPAKPS